MEAQAEVSAEATSAPLVALGATGSSDDDTSKKTQTHDGKDDSWRTEDSPDAQSSIEGEPSTLRPVGKHHQEESDETSDPNTTSPRREPAAVQRGLLDDVVGGVASVAGGVRDSVLQTLAGWARRMPGYELLCTILGRDLVAGTPVPRSAAAIVNGFLGLMPRGDELRQQLQQSGAIDRAGAWFEQEVPKLGLTWATLRSLFTRAWDALSATDLLNPEEAWQRISGIFGPPLARLRGFATGAVTKVAEFVFEGAMAMAGGLGSQVMGIIRRAGDVLQQVLRDPVGFGRNLISAVRGGLGQFLANIGTHLRNGLIGWLTGSLRGAIRMPAQFDLRGIVGMAMEFLGLTWENIRPRIARLIGERAMSLMERGAGIVADIARTGISAITGRIAQLTSGLVDTVIGGIRDWVANSVVGAAVPRLISMFNPAGAVIQAAIAIYNTVQFFIERAQQLGALASAVFDSIASIASGSINNAISAVEQALGRTVPVVLGFLSRLIGLGDLATPVRNIITRVRTMIDSAVDRVIGWIAGMGRRIRGSADAQQNPDSRTLQQKEAALRTAANAARQVVLEDRNPESRQRAFERIRRENSVTTLEIVQDGQADGGRLVHIHAAVNPTYNGDGIIIDRHEPPGPEVLIVMNLAAPHGRQNFERVLAPVTQAGLPATWVRAHLVGQGFGKESPLGLFYAPGALNGKIQNDCLEEIIRGIYEQRIAGAEFELRAQARPHPAHPTLPSPRLAYVKYELIGGLPGQRKLDLFTAEVSVSDSVIPPPTIRVAGISTEIENVYKVSNYESPRLGIERP